MEGRQDFKAKQTLYDEHQLKVEVLDVTNHDGTSSETIRTFGPQSESVATLVLNAKQEVLLLWRNQPTWDTWGWELPRSPIRPREIFSRIARSSVLSQTGWELEKPKAQFSLHGEGYAPSMVHVFLATEAKFLEGSRDVNFSADVSWIPLSEIPGLIRRNEITDLTTQAALFRLIHSQREEPAEANRSTDAAPHHDTNPDI